MKTEIESGSDSFALHSRAKAVRTLVLCDDAWHPAEVVQRGLNALADSPFAFEFVAHGGRWSPALMKDSPLVIMAKTNHLCSTDQTPWLTAENAAAFPEFVRRGGGLLAIHGGIAGCKVLLHMQQSLGGVFLSHPDQGLVTFEPKVGHALTRGVKPFTESDEHYFMALDATDADVFLHSRSEHGVQPAGWTRTEGSGRVCALTPGHNLAVWLNPNFQTLLRNALNWTARLAGVLFLLATFTSSGAETNYDFSAVSARVQGWVDQGYYPGAAVLVAKNNRVIYEKCFGDHTPDTQELIASSGKWLAAATIMSLADEGKLSLDDHPSKFLPEFKNDRKDKATLRQMLSHTSGYPPYQPKENPVDKYQTLPESVTHILPLPLAYPPGERFDYGGLAMQVAGRMAEVATGKDWETIFQERIAQPCRMANTHFTPVDQGGGHSPMLGGGARSTLHDYANFLSMIFNDGKFAGKRVLSKKAVREMQADQIRGAFVKQPEFPARVRGTQHDGIYGLGEWREELDAAGNAVLISSPSWAGAYPWIDKTTGVYGVIIAHVDGAKAGPDKFSGFYSSPELAELVRQIVKRETNFKRPAIQPH